MFDYCPSMSKTRQYLKTLNCGYRFTAGKSNIQTHIYKVSKDLLIESLFILQLSYEAF